MTNKDKIKNNPEAEEAAEDDKISEEGDSQDENDTEADDPLKALKSKAESAEQEAKDSYDRFLRVSAEFENYKKRSAREMEGFKKFANEALIKEMLPVVDNLERAIDSSNSNGGSDDSIVEGVNMTLKEILKIFEKFHVQPIQSVGEMFDPGFHEAVMQEESEEHSENTVLKELQKGYLIHDRLLRPSMVIVSKSKENKNRKNRNWKSGCISEPYDQLSFLGEFSSLASSQKTFKKSIKIYK